MGKSKLQKKKVEQGRQVAPGERILNEQTNAASGASMSTRMVSKDRLAQLAEEEQNIVYTWEEDENIAALRKVKAKTPSELMSIIEGGRREIEIFEHVHRNKVLQLETAIAQLETTRPPEPFPGCSFEQELPFQEWSEKYEKLQKSLAASQKALADRQFIMYKVMQKFPEIFTKDLLALHGATVRNGMMYDKREYQDLLFSLWLRDRVDKKEITEKDAETKMLTLLNLAQKERFIEKGVTDFGGMTESESEMLKDMRSTVPQPSKEEHTQTSSDATRVVSEAEPLPNDLNIASSGNVSDVSSNTFVDPSNIPTNTNEGVSEPAKTNTKPSNMYMTSKERKARARARRK